MERLNAWPLHYRQNIGFRLEIKKNNFKKPLDIE